MPDEDGGHEFVMRSISTARRLISDLRHEERAAALTAVGARLLMSDLMISNALGPTKSMASNMSNICLAAKTLLHALSFDPTYLPAHEFLRILAKILRAANPEKLSSWGGESGVRCVDTILARIVFDTTERGGLTAAGDVSNDDSILTVKMSGSRRVSREIVTRGGAVGSSVFLICQHITPDVNNDGKLHFSLGSLALGYEGWTKEGASHDC
jgi:hypothetical protein